MACVNSIVTGSWLTGAIQLSRFSPEPIAFGADPCVSDFSPRACSGCGRKNAPFTRWPVWSDDGSATDSVAFPAVESTSAACVAVYVLPTPGWNGANAAAGPVSVSASVAGTVPLTPPVVLVVAGIGAVLADSGSDAEEPPAKTVRCPRFVTQSCCAVLQYWNERCASVTDSCLVWPGSSETRENPSSE